MIASLNLEIYPGTDIQNAAKTAQGVANILGIDARFRFNNVSCVAVPDGDAKLLVENWEKEMRTPSNPLGKLALSRRHQR